MKVKIGFSGGKKVSAQFQGYIVMTDQPLANGGEGIAPAPFDLFSPPLELARDTSYWLFVRSEVSRRRGSSLSRRPNGTRQNTSTLKLVSKSGFRRIFLKSIEIAS